MIIHDQELHKSLEKGKSYTDADVARILAKAKELKGISFEEAAILLNLTDRKLLDQLFETAKYVKEAIYGNRIVENRTPRLNAMPAPGTKFTKKSPRYFSRAINAF